jgi:hypothetical protein
MKKMTNYIFYDNNQTFEDMKYVVIKSNKIDTGIASFVKVRNVLVTCKPSIIGIIGPQQAVPESSAGKDANIPVVSEISHLLGLFMII